MRKIEGGERKRQERNLVRGMRKREGGEKEREGEEETRDLFI